MGNKFDNMFSRFDAVNECYRQTLHDGIGCTMYNTARHRQFVTWIAFLCHHIRDLNTVNFLAHRVLLTVTNSIVYAIGTLLLYSDCYKNTV